MSNQTAARKDSGRQLIINIAARHPPWPPSPAKARQAPVSGRGTQTRGKVVTIVIIVIIVITIRIVIIVLVIVVVRNNGRRRPRLGPLLQVPAEGCVGRVAPVERAKSGWIALPRELRRGELRRPMRGFSHGFAGFHLAGAVSPEIRHFPGDVVRPDLL